MGFNLTSTAFEEDANIPTKHSCKGDDTSPPLRWDEVPGGTASFALILEDPDAPNGTFCHWIVYNLPGTAGNWKPLFQFKKSWTTAPCRDKTILGKLGTEDLARPRVKNTGIFFGFLR